ncbi:DUF6279 family lipoprotein [Nitrosomonas sp.]|uniref:DUF6279 family lipoprotein n=1 Tax=Nitrosomonas sp. TaxID=42353 RepID=UPI0026093D51|nr:DUF6279 family lipoprotein [Nitrosomonas sp.]
MRTTLQRLFARSAVIALLLLLSSCSMLRLGYNQGPQLVWWWLDGYVNFSNEQAPHAKQAIHQWFDWHRATQLPEYTAWLSALRGQISDPVTPAQVCGWSEELRNMTAPAFDHAVQLGATLVSGLGEEQLRHIAQRYAKGNDEFRSDYLQPTVEERREASVQRTIKRVENLYGRIDDTQRHLIIDNTAASPFDPEAWLAERQRRQNDVLLTLRHLIAAPTETASIMAALRTLIEHIQHSTDADYRAYQIKLTEYNCAFIARVHNSTNNHQRRHAHDKLKGWETDLRMLTNDIR